MAQLTPLDDHTHLLRDRPCAVVCVPVGGAGDPDGLPAQWHRQGEGPFTSTSTVHTYLEPSFHLPTSHAFGVSHPRAHVLVPFVPFSLCDGLMCLCPCLPSLCVWRSHVSVPSSLFSLCGGVRRCTCRYRTVPRSRSCQPGSSPT